MIDRRDVIIWLGALLADRPPPPPMPRALTAQHIIAVDRQVRSTFQYQQPVEHPSWDQAADVAAHRIWRGNCVTLVMTTLAVLRKAGAPQNTLYALLVRDYERHGEHAVGLAQDDAGRKWIVGDTFSGAYPMAQMRHTFEREYRY